MATKVVMPALGMAQETGVLVNWLKKEGQVVQKGEPLIEIETDKTTVEFDAQANGILSGIRVAPGQTVPVGEALAWLLAPGEQIPAESAESSPIVADIPKTPISSSQQLQPPADQSNPPAVPLPIVEVSPIARKMAEEHELDLTLIVPKGNRIQKADVLAYLDNRRITSSTSTARLRPASPKARRLAGEQGVNLAQINGSGPNGSVIAQDVDHYLSGRTAAPTQKSLAISRTWQVMADRLSQSWSQSPHFYLVREVNASALIDWRQRVKERTGQKVTFTDLLIKIVGASLRANPQVNASWDQGKILLNNEVNVGIAVAIENGLMVPVIHQADKISLTQITERRQTLLERAKNGRLDLTDLQNGTFTLSNLGMYGVDAFNAIVNPPQAAILAAGRITDRVVAENGLAVVRPTLMLTLSCDHRVIDGARAAAFLELITTFIEDPLAIME